MANKKDWLKKVGQWLINQSEDNDKDEFNNEISKEVKNKPLQPKENQEKNQNISSKKNTILDEITIERAFKIFLLSWQDEGFSKKYFINIQDSKELLNSLDKQFKDEITQWLFKCSNQVEIMHNLEKIIKLGRVSVNSDTNAIRAFSYLSILLASNQIELKEVKEEELNKKSVPFNQEQIELKEVKEEELNKKSVPFNQEQIDLKLNQLKKENYSKVNLIENESSVEENQFNYSKSKESELNQYIKSELQSDKNITAINYKASLSELGLNMPTYNSLRRANIDYISDLSGMEENDFLSLNNFGPKKLDELKSSLINIGINIPFYIGEKTEIIFKKKKEIQKDNYDEVFWKEFKNKFRTERIIFENIEKLLEEFTEFNLDINHEVFKSNSYKDNLQMEFNILISYFKVEAKKGKIDDESKNFLIYLIFKKFITHIKSKEAKKWIINFKNLILKNENYIYAMSKRLKSSSLQEIAKELELSRERIRQMEEKFLKYIDISSLDFRNQLSGYLDNKKFKKEKLLIEKYITEFNHLPFINEENEYKNKNKFLNEISLLNLFQRIETYKNYKLEIPENEYDYHYKYISEDLGQVGNGYWSDIENLKNYLYRHAEYLGEPDLMPKQTSTPYKIKGVVQRHGGQSVVSNKIGLIYQGQLVNVDGTRVYWTDERLSKLLDDVNIFSKQNIDIMPSHGNIIDFFKATNLQEYENKKPSSAVAALTKLGNLAWLEVAQRFNKKHFSGITQKVTVQFIKAFVRDLGEHLTVLSPSELFVLFQAQGINRKEQEKFSRTFDVLIDAVQTGVVNKKDLEDWSNNVEVPSIKELLNLGGEVKLKYSKEEKELRLQKRKANILNKEYEDSKSIKLNEITKEDLPNLDPRRTLRALDKAAGILEGSGTDAERIEFLKAKASSKLWDSCFLDEKSLIRNLESSKLGLDTYSEEVRKKFLEEYNGAKNLRIPSSYKFRDLKGRERQPKLMQKLVSYRLLTDKRVLNLSGTGTGKTLSAILASQICESKRIFISCPNGVIDSWIRTFKSAYPEAVLHIKPENWNINIIQNAVNVVIVNHERFQDRFSDNLLHFSTKFSADMIVIDEIHQSKKREEHKSSQRRSLINQFIRISINLNPNVRVLGLSATPVINNIYEGRSLVELITQKELLNVKDDDDINSCMNLYQHFIINGIRMNPGNLSRTEIIPRNVDASALLPEIIAYTRRGLYHDVERLLVKPKLDTLNKCINKGEKTIIFITLIKGTLIPITNWLNKNNFRFCVYTGNDKEATEEGFKDSLDEFIRGETEVLVASVRCAGTGVDGLQSICNKAVFFQLPWTSTEFEQSIGRLDRDGTEFDSVSVYLPITNINLPNGDSWSWCQNKMERIRSKKDIAKAAVDGEIPDANSMFTPNEASKYWLEWLKRLEES